MAQGTYNVCLVNSADPRGLKVGGIETYTRDYIYYHPSDMNLLFIGPDEVGDLDIGKINRVTFRGREFDFLPLYRLSDSTNRYSSSIFATETFHFARTLIKHFRLIRRTLRNGGYSVEIRRVEYAPIIRAMGVPFIQMVHVWGAKDKKMSSLLGRYWIIRDATEFVAAALAHKYYSVNSDMTAMYKRKYKAFAAKFDTLTTWANETIFARREYEFADKINIFYAGRLDKFKRPDKMFSVVALVEKLRPGAVTFHYVGDGDPTDFPEFKDITDLTCSYGRRESSEIAVLLSKMHIGILTSDFEGMPRVVLEVLTTGRPVVALHLPQLEGVVVNNVSGQLVPRGEDEIKDVAERILETYDSMVVGDITPERVAKVVEPFSPRRLLSKIFSDHRRLHGLPCQSKDVELEAATTP